MVTETSPFDAAEYFAGPEDEADLLSDAIADGDSRYIVASLGAVARAHGGVDKLAASTGMSGETLHKALSEAGDLTLDIAIKVFGALGLRLAVVPSNPNVMEFVGNMSAALQIITGKSFAVEPANDDGSHQQRVEA